MAQVIGLVSHQNIVSFQELVLLAQTLQEQVTHFKEFWPNNNNYLIKAFRGYEDFEPGAWPIIFVENIPGSKIGYHQLQSGKPIAYVEADQFWTIVASHECLEMIIDPYGNKTVTGYAPLDNQNLNLNRAVEYLIEICDPCQSPQFAYAIGKVWVSDFVTPAYFKPPDIGSRYSYTKQIAQPCSVGALGYVSYAERKTGKWFQWKADSSGISNEVALQNLDLSSTSARFAIYRSVGKRDFSSIESTIIDRMVEQGCQCDTDYQEFGLRLKAEVSNHLNQFQVSRRSSRSKKEKQTINKRKD
jgi:hypothetical protein